MEPNALAQSIADAYARREQIPAPSSADPSFDLAAAYATEASLVNLRAAQGHRAVGLKVGFANKAVWRVMKLDTLVWAHMYDDTVRMSEGGAATLSLASMFSPKIEPEVVFKIGSDFGTADRGADAAALPAADVLASVEWLAIGFEIIDCVYPDWKFQPADFVAGYGLHAALIVGEPRVVEPAEIPGLVDRLARFTVRLSKNGDLVAEGAGRNSLRSPALCLAELDTATRRQGGSRLVSGDLVSSGTLTESQPIASGENWRVDVDGLDLPPLTVTIGGR